MNTSPRRGTEVLIVGAGPTGLVLALWLSKQFHAASVAATLVSVVLAIPSTALAWFAYRSDRREAASDLGAKARTLAAAVLASETEQVKQFLGRGGHRIDLAFRYFPEPANNAAGAASDGSPRPARTPLPAKSLRPAATRRHTRMRPALVTLATTP